MMDDDVQQPEGQADGQPEAPTAGVETTAVAAGAVRDTRAAAQRRWWWVGLAALVAIVVATIAVFAAGGDDSAAGGSSATSTAGSDASAGTDAPATSATAAPDTEGSTVDGATTVVPESSVPGSSVPVDVGTTVAGAPTTAVTTPVPPQVSFVPGNGDTVPVQTVATAPPVSIDDVADPGTGMSFRLDRLEAVQGEANGPGEIAGPAVRVTVSATNDTGAPVLLETVVVDLVYGPDRSSAAPLSGPGVVRFAGELAEGDSATAVYVFDVPVDQRDEVSVIVSYTAAVSPVVFTGAAPRP